MEIRYAVMRNRYYFGLIAYVTIAVKFYLLLVIGSASLITSLDPGPEPALLVAVPTTIAFMVLAPHHQSGTG